ncbi:rod-binding protein [Aquabacter spiritensis]|uniref:Rod binding protein n=1 Tax=Aquabacter spiritensis TaxID=933073 RepID=A0A4R3M9A0_9HYPH|nr:rod-binding protein [Aquabacter spiritensis]TCT07955.1 rod binding protein [Aquabacter spiritensis]
MGIQPPSDLILDVINAADPKRAQAIAAQLKQASASSQAPAPAEGFGEELARIPLDPMPRLSASSSLALRNATALSQKGGASAADPYRRFEAMVLSSFVDSLLPAKSEATFGSGTAGNIWRSMLAERIAGEVAKSGGIGIADRIAGAPSTAGARPS